MDTPDQTLLERWTHHRDPEAFSELVRRHSGMVAGTCRRILHNEADAQDVAQDCFLTLMEKAPAFRRDAYSLAGWLHRVATRLALNRRRSAGRTRARELAFGNTSPTIEPAPIDDIPTHVDEAIGALPHELAEVLILHFFEGMTHQAIADRTGVPRRTVTSRITRGIDEVRHRLERKGVIVTASALAALLTGEAAHAMAAPAIAVLAKHAIAGVSAPAASSLTWTTLGVAIMSKATLIIAAAGVAAVVAATIFARIDRDVTPALAPAASEVTPVAALSRHDEPLHASPAVLISPARVVGMVRDTSGNAIEGATVRYDTGGANSTTNTATTDADGAFAIPGPAVGTKFVLSAEKDGWLQSARERLTMKDSGVDGVVLTLLHAASAEGVVLDSMKRPVENKQVLAICDADDYCAPAKQSTDRAGRFRLSPLHPGAYRVAVQDEGNDARPDIVDARIEITEGQSLTGIRIVLFSEEPLVAGRVVDDEGVPIAGARVQCLWKDISPSTTTDDEGRFRLTRLPTEGPVLLAASDRKHEHFMSNAETGQEDVEIVMTTPRPGTVTGRVFDAATHAPIREFEVMSRSGVYVDISWTQLHEFMQVNDDYGRFSLDKVPEGEATIVVCAKGYAPSIVPVFLEKSGSDDVVVPMTRGHSLRVVVTTHDGKPVQSATVFAGDAPSQESLFMPGAVMSDEVAALPKTDDAGYTAMADLASGPVTLIARHATLGSGSVTVDPGEVDEAQIRIGMGGTIRGTVTIAGEPASGAAISTYTTSSLGLWDGNADVDDNGTFELVNVPEGEIRISVMLRGTIPFDTYRFSWRDVEVREGEPVDLSLDFVAGAATVQGTVFMLGDPLAQANVSIYTEGQHGTERSTTRTNSSGQFTFENVPKGHARLNAQTATSTSDGSVWIMTMKGVSIDVLEQGVVHQDIELSGTAQLSGQITGIAPLEQGRVWLLEDAPDLGDFQQEDLAAMQPNIRAETTAQRDGTYLLDHLDEGTYTTLIVVNTHSSRGEFRTMRHAYTTIQIQDGASSVLDFNMR